MVEPGGRGWGPVQGQKDHPTGLDHGLQFKEKGGLLVDL